MLRHKTFMLQFLWCLAPKLAILTGLILYLALSRRCNLLFFLLFTFVAKKVGPLPPFRRRATPLWWATSEGRGTMTLTIAHSSLWRWSLKVVVRVRVGEKPSWEFKLLAISLYVDGFSPNLEVFILVRVEVCHKIWILRNFQDIG